MKSQLLRFFNPDTLGSTLLILFGFALPLSVAINNMFAIALLLLWLYQKKYRKTLQMIQHSRFLVAIILFYMLHFVGLLWTEDLVWGLHIIKKEWVFLLLPIMMTFIKQEHIKYYIGAFLVAMSISEILSYLIWFEVIPPFKSATVYDPTPFMSHISYNPFLAFAIYIIGYYILFDALLSKRRKLVYMVFLITMSINMFITGGRAGQIAYLLVISILLFQYFRKSIWKAILAILLTLSGVLSLAYTNSTLFNDRVNSAVIEINHFDIQSAGTVGLRLNWAINTLLLIKQNPIIGVGTGDFVNEYRKVSLERTPHLQLTAHPHNMYLLEMAQFGILGLLSLLSILLMQILFALKSKDSLIQNLGMTLPLIFFVIMFSDVYLLGHYTTMLFMYFSAILYKPFPLES